MLGGQLRFEDYFTNLKLWIWSIWLTESTFTSTHSAYCCVSVCVVWGTEYSIVTSLFHLLVTVYKQFINSQGFCPLNLKKVVLCFVVSTVAVKPTNMFWPFHTFSTGSIICHQNVCNKNQKLQHNVEFKTINDSGKIWIIEIDLNVIV